MDILTEKIQALAIQELRTLERVLRQSSVQVALAASRFLFERGYISLENGSSSPSLGSKFQATQKGQAVVDDFWGITSSDRRVVQLVREFYGGPKNYAIYVDPLPSY